MDSHCAYRGQTLGQITNCQFPTSQEKLHKLGGKSWCLLHLPVELNGEFSAKKYRNQSEDDWDAYVGSFNSIVFEYIQNRMDEIRILTESESVSGDYEIDLSGVIFPGFINFADCPGLAPGPVGLNLSNAKFHGLAEFSNLQFFGVTSFINTTFVRKAYFDNCKFDLVSFNHSYFGGVADFEKAAFTSVADFRNCVYNDEAVFSQCETASGSNISFAESEFRYGAVFRNANFAGKVSFTNTQFGGGVYLESATFKDDVVFDQSVDSRQKTPSKSVPRDIVNQLWFVELEDEPPGKWLVKNTKFHGRASFRGRSFLAPTSFDNCEFQYIPEFQDATFYVDTTFRNARFNTSFDHENSYGLQAISALRNATKNLLSKEEEVNLLGTYFELTLRNKHTPLAQKFILLGFRFIGDYGRRLNRILLFLVLSNLIFWISYELITWSGVSGLGKCVQFAINQLLSPFSLWADSFSKSAPDFIIAELQVLRPVASLHSTISALILCAFLWSLQIRFRVF